MCHDNKFIEKEKCTVEIYTSRERIFYEQTKNQLKRISNSNL